VMLEVTEMPIANPPAELPPRERSSLAVRVVTILAILIPLGGVIAAPFFVWGWGFL
jgi:stearoyl-CoA desaturase (Delta-9 desaturase)